jgi:hypothetical protein
MLVNIKTKYNITFSKARMSILSLIKQFTMIEWVEDLVLGRFYKRKVFGKVLVEVKLTNLTIRR